MGGGASTPAVVGLPDGAPSGGLASTSYGDLWLPHRRHPSPGLSGTGTSEQRIEDLRSTMFVLEEDAIYEDQPPNPVLSDLAFAGYSAEIERKLNSHTDTEKKDLLAQKEWSWHGTPLHAACAGGHADAVKILLKNGADIHAVDTNGCTALHYAALLPAADCVAALLDASQGPVVPSDMAEELHKLKHDGPAGNWVTHDEESVLLLAAYSRSSEVVELLLTRKAVAAIDATDVCGTTPLHLAAYIDSVPCCTLLVDAGASTTILDGDGEQAFDVTNSGEIQAALRGDTKITENDEETEGRHLDDETLHDEGETIVKDTAPLRQSKQNVEDVASVALPFDNTALYRARALFKSSGGSDEDDDLRFELDDIIDVLSDHVPDWEGWSIGRTNGKMGFFPTSYCERIVEAAPVSQEAPETEADAVQSGEEFKMGTDASEEDVAAMTSKINRLLEERNDLLREKRHLQQADVHSKQELKAARSEIAQLHEQLRDMSQQAKEFAAEHAKAADARNAKLSELQTSEDAVVDGDATESGKASGVLKEQVLNLQDNVKMLNSQLHHAKLAEKLAHKQSRSMHLAAVREREHWLSVEKDLQARLSAAASTVHARNRSLATVRRELAHAKLQSKLNAKHVTEEDQAIEHDKATKKDLVACSLLTAALRARYYRVEEQFHTEAQQRRKLHNKLQDLAGNIRVYARIRPLLPFEKERGDKSIVTTDGREIVRIPDAQGNGIKSFKFSGCFAETSTQVDVFKESQELIQSVFDGYNACIFAYGQSGSECRLSCVCCSSGLLSLHISSIYYIEFLCMRYRRKDAHNVRR